MSLTSKKRTLLEQISKSQSGSTAHADIVRAFKAAGADALKDGSGTRLEFNGSSVFVKDHRNSMKNKAKTSCMTEGLALMAQELLDANPA